MTLLAFERELEAAVHSLALGKVGRVAALGAEAWLDAGKGFEKLPAPPSSSEHVRIFFGRDNQPRLMGFAGDAPVYLRWRGGAWQHAASEIGRLGGGAAEPLYGVLGHADPEVVCKRGDACIIKRLTGWKTIAPLPGTPRVTLASDTAWAFEGARVWRLEDDAFRRVGGETPPFASADALWATGASDVWVAERAAGSVHHFDGERWTRHAAPVAGPRGLWGSGSADVWLAGDGGAAHWDGTRWSRVAGAPEGLAVATGSGASDVWLAGSAGVWHGTAPR